MKKILSLGAILLFSVFIISCDKNPIEYEIEGVFEKNDWELWTKKDVTPAYRINKKIPITNLVNNPLLENQQLTLQINGQLTSTTIKLFPESNEFKDILNEVLNTSESQCKNKATFKPYELEVMFIEKKEPRTPTKEDIKNVEEEWNFLKPHLEVYNEAVKNSLETIKNGENERFIITSDYLASNAYGTPGKLSSMFTYDLKTKNLTYIGTTER